MTNHYYSLLTDLSQRLSKEDLNNLVFACSNVLPPSVAEKVTNGFHLFRELKQRGHLGPANYDYLRKQLELVGRNDLASMLPDQFEILFGRSSVRDKRCFGCFVSPTAPEPNLVNAPESICCHPNTESRIFLMHLSQQLSFDDAAKLTFLMYPTHSQVTALEFAELLEREGGLNSIDLVSRLSSCLEAVGRLDLAKFLNSLKAPLLFSTPLSTSQQQLNLKIRLLLHSKQQSYDFYMKALNQVEGQNEVRIKLLSPIAGHFQKSFDYLTISSLAQCLQVSAASNKISFNSLIRASLMEALQVNQAYSTRTSLLYCDKIDIEKLSEVTEVVFGSYKSFNSLMDILRWNRTIRGELEEDVDLRRSPFGTPAEFVCQYILEVSKEISQCSGLSQEMMTTDRHLFALSSIYYCCCHHVLVLQWLASLLCFSVSFGSALLDLSKYKETLWHVVQQKKDDIMRSYSHLANIIGPDILKQLIPAEDSLSADTDHSTQNPFTHFFNVLIIKLLAVATLGPDSLNICDTFYSVDDKFYDQAWLVGSHELRVSAAAMKKQVEAFREKALSVDRLCSRVIATLTDNN